MTIPILCYECGNDLGEIFEFVNYARQGFTMSEMKLNTVDIDKVELNPNIAKPIGFILDAVNIDKICCRTHLIGYVDCNKYFN